MSSRQLCLGTVQFGLDYGITNQSGQVSMVEATKILSYAQKRQIVSLDTAVAYGDSEQRIGQILKEHDWSFKIMTKLPAKVSAKNCKQYVLLSLMKLGVNKLHAVMLHHSQDLLNSNSLYQVLIELKEQGLIENIGISVYKPEEVFAVCEHYQIDLIQLPLSLFDQRFLQDDLLIKLAQQGILVYARSLFLQGILLAKPSTLPSYFQCYQENFKLLGELQSEYSLTPLQLALSWLKQSLPIKGYVIGCCLLEQLQEICAAIDTLPDLELSALQSLASINESLILPNRWPKQ